jgi:ABC-type amino acid transport substrate-binding protein
MRRCRVRAFPAPRGIVGAALLATVLALTGCAGPRAVSSAAPSTATPPLRVGIAPDFPPLAFRQNGAPAGVEVDFARHLDLDHNSALSRSVSRNPPQEQGGSHREDSPNGRVFS